VKVKEGILVHASKILDPEFQVVNQNKSKVLMPASFLNNQSAGTVIIHPRLSVRDIFRAPRPTLAHLAKSSLRCPKAL
jgi:hypothetical protein